MLQSLLYPYGDFHHTAWWNSQYHKLQNSMEFDSVGIIAILSMSYITVVVKYRQVWQKPPECP